MGRSRPAPRAQGRRVATAALPASQADEIAAASKGSAQKALMNMAYFPAFMLAAYIVLIVYFRSRGGYAAQVLTGHAAEDKKFTGGVPGAMEA